MQIKISQNNLNLLKLYILIVRLQQILSKLCCHNSIFTIELAILKFVQIMSQSTNIVKIINSTSSSGGKLQKQKKRLKQDLAKARTIFSN